MHRDISRICCYIVTRLEVRGLEKGCRRVRGGDGWSGGGGTFIEVDGLNRAERLRDVVTSERRSPHYIRGVRPCGGV